MAISEVYNMDCMEGMRKAPDKFWDLCITSPPYNLGEKHHTGSKRFKAYNTYKDDVPEDVYQMQQVEFLNTAYRVMSANSSLFYNHKNRIKNGLQITPYEWILKTKWIVKQEIVWFNRSQNFDKCRFYPMTERIYWLAKDKETTFCNHINHHDLFTWSAEGTENLHKRAFPLEMAKDILSCFPQSSKVFDPYSGSQTTRIAAYKLGFDFWGYELDEQYFNEGNKRFAEAIKEPLFQQPVYSQPTLL